VTPETAGDVGHWCYNLAAELFPICRSITGDGVRHTLQKLSLALPGLTIHEVPSGTRCLDWVVPDEWNIRDAYIVAPDGRKLCDFKQHNLHVVNYSVPVDRTVTLDELKQHLHTLPQQPEAIPYVTAYYARSWGFCMAYREYEKLAPGAYRVVIDSTLEPGHLTYGEWLLPGTTPNEIFLSTYVCHPSMANNELSGPVVATALARWIATLPSRRYSYRLVFIPETIGSIVYISRHVQTLRERVKSGFVITCCGDERTYSYLPSRLGDTLADRIALHVLQHHVGDFGRYPYRERGSDERQYCSPGVDLPMASIMRSKYAAYPEYHNSLDDLSLVSAEGLAGGYDVLRRAIEALENNLFYRTTVLGEPNLGSRGLYPLVSPAGGRQTNEIRNFLDVLAYSDGSCDLLAIADRIGCPIWTLYDTVRSLRSHQLLEPHGENGFGSR
jgi:aminopeptidase-like protein